MGMRNKKVRFRNEKDQPGKDQGSMRAKKPDGKKLLKWTMIAAGYCSMSDSAATAEATEETTATMTAMTMTNRPPARRMNMSITSFLNDFLYSIPFFSKNNKQFFGRKRDRS